MVYLVADEVLEFNLTFAQESNALYQYAECPEIFVLIVCFQTSSYYPVLYFDECENFTYLLFGSETL
jgi:hypothetical protein